MDSDSQSAKDNDLERKSDIGNSDKYSDKVNDIKVMLILTVTETVIVTQTQYRWWRQ